MRTPVLFSAVLLLVLQSYAVQVTVQTNPAGRSFVVDGTTYTTTQVFNWTSGTAHTISATLIQNADTTTRYVWKTWSDSGAISHIVSPSSDVSYTAGFSTQFYLTMISENSCGNWTLWPGSGWYGKDTNMYIGAQIFNPPPHCILSAWTGSGSGSYTGPPANATITMQGPITETGTFVPCIISMNPNSASYDWNGGSGSYTVSTPCPCLSPPEAYVPWVHLTFSNPGQIYYTVDPNPDTTSRIAGINTFGCIHVPTAFFIYQSSQTSTRWEFPLTLNDACGDTGTIRLGQKTNATNGIDPSLGEVDLPPVPPVGAFDVRLILPSPSTSASLKDFRRDTLTSVDWRLTFQPGVCGYPLTFRWDSAGVPSDATLFLKDEFGGILVNVDMKNQSSYLLTISGISSLKIEYRRRIRRDVVLNSGWNLVSVPLKASSMLRADLFPTIATPAYRYSGGYQIADTLTPTQGYWLKSPADSSTTSSVLGYSDTTSKIAVVAGWNIVGPSHFNIATVSLATSPPGIIQTPFYNYSSGYVTADTLKIGKGYWIKVSQSGTLDIGTGLSKSTVPMYAMDESWMRVEITDNNGMRSNVYFAPDREHLSGYALPPYGPSGMTDIRFSNNTVVEDATKKQYELLLYSTAFPLRIKTYNMMGRVLSIRDNINGNLLNAPLSEGGEVVVALNLPSIDLIEIQGAEQKIVPGFFALNQNYPNPFNPSTKIAYQLPEAARVSLIIYDILGRKVVDLVKEQQQPGFYTATWDASEVASGVYFARFISTDANGSMKFSKVNKLLLTK